jgi:arabinogalactan oligomer/maltooligosaccharide transport system permease protein
MSAEVTAQTTAIGAARAETQERVYRRRGERGPAASIMLHAGLIAATFVSLFPVVWVLLSSFKPGAWVRSSEIALIKEPTLVNYRHVLLDTSFPRWFLNSLIVASATMVIGVLISATAGYAVSRYRFPGKRTLMWTFLFTQMFPVAILIVPIYTIMARLGLINTHPALVVAYLTIAVPFCAWMMKGYFDTIPIELDEAARVDGLGPFGVFWQIIVPLSRPGLAVTAFYAFITAWGEVAYASAFMQTDNRFTLAYGLQQFVPRFNPQWEYLTAAAVLVTVPAAVVFFFAQKHLVGGLTAGGMKG